MADADDDQPKERLHLSLTQIAVSSGAAVSAAVICSLFGVAGTVIGTAIASIAFTIASALYAHSLERTKSRLRRLHQAGAASPPFAEVVKTTRQQGRQLVGQIPWRIVAPVAAAVFVASIALITAVELGIGKPLSALFGVSHSGNRTTSIGIGGHRHHKPKSTPSPTDTSTTPAPTPTATVTKTVTPTPTPSLSQSPPPTTSATPTPSTTPTGAAS